MNQDNNREEIGLSNVLKNSETELKAEQEMSDYFIRPGAPKIVQWIIKYSGGLVKNEKQASYLLLGFIAAMIVLSLFLIFSKRGIKTQEAFAPAAEAPLEEVIPPVEF